MPFILHGKYSIFSGFVILNWVFEIMKHEEIQIFPNKCIKGIANLLHVLVNNCNALSLL